MKAKDNPFRVQRLDALRYRPQGMTWDDIARRMEQCRFRGAIVGPHGSGKSTLMDELANRLETTGFRVVRVFVNADSPESFGTAALPDSNPNDVVLFDGADLLSPWRWLVVKRAPRLIITTHREGLLPTVVQTATSEELLRELIVELLGAKEAAAITKEINALYARHQGNLRGALLELYDRYAAARSGLPPGGRSGG